MQCNGNGNCRMACTRFGVDAVSAIALMSHSIWHPHIAKNLDETKRNPATRTVAPNLVKQKMSGFVYGYGFSNRIFRHIWPVPILPGS